MMMLIPLAAAFLLALTYNLKFSKRAAVFDLVCLVFLASLAPESAALLATLAIEGTVVFFLAKALALPPTRLVLASLLINTLTHPLFVLFATTPSQLSWLANFLFGEAAVFGIEAILYVWILGAPFSGHSLRRALGISFLANLASAGIGLFLPL